MTRSHYRETSIAPAYAGTVRRALAWCARDLGLGPMRPRWLVRATAEEVARFRKEGTVTHSPLGPCSGFFDARHAGAVFLAVDLSEAEAVHTVVHEARHAWQHRRWGKAPLEEIADREADAEAYARRVAAAIGAGGSAA